MANTETARNTNQGTTPDLDMVRSDAKFRRWFNWQTCTTTRRHFIILLERIHQLESIISNATITAPTAKGE